MAIMVPVEVKASPRKSLADAASELLCVCWPMRWLNQQRISIDTAEMAAMTAAWPLSGAAACPDSKAKVAPRPSHMVIRPIRKTYPSRLEKRQDSQIASDLQDEMYQKGRWQTIARQSKQRR